MATLAPIPRAKARMASAAKPGCFAIMRKAYRMSESKVCIVRGRRSDFLAGHLSLVTDHFLFIPRGAQSRDLPSWLAAPECSRQGAQLIPGGLRGRSR